jgi:DNA-binding GntR family transcriptional regulator
VVSIKNDDESIGSLARQASGYFKTEIIKGDLKPGKAISIDEISEAGTYSNAVIREGLARLLASQLVVDDQDGFQVADQNADDLDDLRHTRFLLEGVALRDSIMNGDAEWERSVTANLERLHNVAPSAWLTAEAAQVRKEFHQALISGSGLKRILAFLDVIYDQCSWYSVTNGGSPCTDFNGHKTLVEAALARDAEAASEQLRMLLFPVAHADGASAIDN